MTGTTAEHALEWPGADRQKRTRTHRHRRESAGTYNNDVRFMPRDQGRRGLSIPRNGKARHGLVDVSHSDIVIIYS